MQKILACNQHRSPTFPVCLTPISPTLKVQVVWVEKVCVSNTVHYFDHANCCVCNKDVTVESFFLHHFSETVALPNNRSVITNQ